MIWFYRLLYLPGLLVALPYYILRMWRRGGYGKSFQHRFGRFHHLEAPKAGRTRIWLQAVSVGEVLAIGPLIKALQNEPGIELVLTTTTSTGYTEARKRYTGIVLSIGIFPLDFWLFSHTAWKRIQPDAIVLTESELWPEHLHQARRRGVPAYLVNARISDKSFRRYQKVPSLASRMLKKFRAIYAASELDRSRFIELGCPSGRIISGGSIKFDVAIGERLSEEGKQALRSSLGFGGFANDPQSEALRPRDTPQSEALRLRHSPQSGALRPQDTPQSGALRLRAPLVLLGSSTWPGEEAALLDTQRSLIAAGIDCRLLLVPRHAERAPELVSMLKAQDLPWHQRSTGGEVAEDIRIYLADTTGELTRLTQAADLAFIGKSLAPNQGGQTPIEAAGLGVPVLMGPQMNNFKDVAASLTRSGAALRVSGAAELTEAVRKLSGDDPAREAMGRAGMDWHRANRGSSQRIAEGILESLKREFQQGTPPIVNGD